MGMFHGDDDAKENVSEPARRQTINNDKNRVLVRQRRYVVVFVDCALRTTKSVINRFQRIYINICICIYISNVIVYAPYKYNMGAHMSAAADGYGQSRQKGRQWRAGYGCGSKVRAI